jgi:hypothetical protein
MRYNPAEMRFLRTMILAGLVLAPTQLTAQGPTIIVDNERVTAREIAWPQGVAAHASRDRDAIVVFLKSGIVEFVAQKNTLVPPGSADDRRSIVIELKDHKVEPLPNTSGFPNAFPRPNAAKVLENTRVLAWDYTWSSGVATPVHFHDKDVVVIYLADGALTSTTPDGKKTVNEHAFGYTKFNPRNRIHTETLTRGQARAIIVELKD